MKDLSPQALEYYELWQDTRSPHAHARFAYQNLPDSERLRYTLLSWENYTTYLQLFENDSNIYVSNQFKSKEKLDEYAVALLEFNYYSGKRGACDWFLSMQDGTYIGALHLYDLNFEIYNGKHPTCMFGYVIAASYRRQGYAYEASLHLLKHIPLIFKRYEVMANPKIENVASMNLLKKLGFDTLRKIGKDKDEMLWYKKLIEGEIPPATYL